MLSAVVKCKILETKLLRKFVTDHTKTTEWKLKGILQNIKNVFIKKEFKQLYPTGRKPGVFSGSAKVHKLKKRERLKKLALRCIVSITRMATYPLYLLENWLTFLMKIKRSTFLFKTIFLKKITSQVQKFIKKSFQFKIKSS